MNIIITGSTRGIGLGMAKEFLIRGHQVVINGRSQDRIDEAIVHLGSLGGDLTGLVGDTTEAATHQNLLDHAVKKFGSVDFYINNAGIPQPHMLFQDISSEDIKKLIDTNIYGLMMGSGIVVRFMQEQGYGKIFNMEGFGSDGRIMKKLTLYGTSKRAVNYFTKSLAKEVSTGPVQVGVISPGMVRTEFLDQSKSFITPEEKKQWDKVYRILAEDVEVVTPYLVKGMLQSQKNYDRIAFLSGTRLMFKIIRLMFSK